MLVVYGIACFLVYAVNALASEHARPKYTDAAGVSALLCFSFGMSNVLIEALGFPEAVALFPILDSLLAFMVWCAWRRQRSWWKLAVVALLVVQLVSHVAFIAAWNDGTLQHYGARSYAALLNATFTGQLLAVGSAGASYWLARLISWVSDSGRHHSWGHARR